MPYLFHFLGLASPKVVALSECSVFSSEAIFEDCALPLRGSCICQPSSVPGLGLRLTRVKGAAPSPGWMTSRFTSSCRKESAVFSRSSPGSTSSTLIAASGTSARVASAPCSRSAYTFEPLSDFTWESRTRTGSPASSVKRASTEGLSSPSLVRASAESAGKESARWPRSDWSSRFTRSGSAR